MGGLQRGSLDGGSHSSASAFARSNRFLFLVLPQNSRRTHWSLLEEWSAARKYHRSRCPPQTSTADDRRQPPNHHADRQSDQHPLWYSGWRDGVLSKGRGGEPAQARVCVRHSQKLHSQLRCTLDIRQSASRNQSALLVTLTAANIHRRISFAGRAHHSEPARTDCEQRARNRNHFRSSDQAPCT